MRHWLIWLSSLGFVTFGSTLHSSLWCLMATSQHGPVPPWATHVADCVAGSSAPQRQPKNDGGTPGAYTVLSQRVRSTQSNMSKQPSRKLGITASPTQRSTSSPHK